MRKEQLPLPKDFTQPCVKALVYFLHASLQTPLLKQVVEECDEQTFDMCLLNKKLSFDKPQWLAKAKLDIVLAQQKHRVTFKGNLEGVALLLDMCSHNEDAYQVLKARVPPELLVF